MEHDLKLNGKEAITHQRSVEKQLSIFEYKEQEINSYLEEEFYNSQSEGKDIDQDNHSTIT